MATKLKLYYTVHFNPLIWNTWVKSKVGAGWQISIGPFTIYKSFYIP